MAMTDERLKQLVHDNLSEDGEALDLSWQGLDDDDLRRLVPLLAGLPGLTALSLGGTQITDAGLAHLAGLPGLTALFIAETQITDAGLAHLAGLPGLTTLSLWGTQITDAGLAAIRTSLPDCAVCV